MSLPPSDQPSLDHTIEKEKEAEFNANRHNNNNNNQNGFKTKWNLKKDLKEDENSVLLERSWDIKRDTIQYDTFDSISFANWIFSGTMWMILLLMVFSQIKYLSSKAAASPSVDNKEPDKTSVSQNKFQDIEAAVPLNEKLQKQQLDIEAAKPSTSNKNKQQLTIEMAISPAISAEMGGIIPETSKEQNQPGVEIIDSAIFIPVSTRNSIVSLEEILQQSSSFRLQISVLCHFDSTSKWTEIRKKYYEQIEQDPSLTFREFCKNRGLSKISCLYMPLKSRKMAMIVYLIFSFTGLSLLFRFVFNRVVPSLKLSLDKFII